MKKIKNFASPFIMLLIPLFILIGLLAMNVRNEDSSEKQNVELRLQAPTLKNIFKAVFK